MNEKLLLRGALAATVLAAGFGAYKLHGAKESPPIAITPVPPIDGNRLSHAEIPIRLTASDGTGLRLVGLDARSALEDPLALTELHLVFQNPEARVLEGTFRITLPQGASLSRFAMKVGSQWQEGEVVEKQRARAVYEDFLHRKQDPALMEQGAGNEFTARVFPIPAGGTKEIIVTYSEVLEAGAAYVLPLKGLPALDRLDVEVFAAGAKAPKEGNGRSDATFAIHQTAFTPGDDFVVPPQKLPRSGGLRAGELAMARVVPFAASRPDPIKSALFLVDTSASRALGLSDQLKLLGRVLAKLPGDAKVSVACFDQEVVSVYDGEAKGFGEKEIAAITARGALGASDVEQAIAFAATEAKKKHLARVVFLGDGVATAGETDGQKLKSKVEVLRASGVERIDALAMGGIRDDGLLRSVVRGVLDKDGVVLDGALGETAIARRLSEATSSGVPVKVEGARWSWPRTLDGLQAGDEIMVYAEIDGSAPFKIEVGGQPFSPDLRTTERPLVERAWAQAKIQSLVESPTESPEATKQQIIALSTRHRVLSPHTAMLVLETDWDYQRFGIDRKANVDILAVKDGRASVLRDSREKNAAKDTETDDSTAAPTTGRKGGLAKSKADTRPQTATASEESARAPTANAAAAAPAGPGAPTGSAGQLDGLLDRNAADRGDLGRSGAEAQNRATGGERERAETEPSAPEAAARPAPAAVPPAEVPPDLRGYLPAQPAATTTAAASAATPPPSAPALRAPAANRPITRPSPAPDPAPPPPPPPTNGTATRATGTVRAGALVVDRGFAQGVAQGVVRGALPLVRACYNDALGANPTLGGTIELSLVVDKTGTVVVADVVGNPAGSATAPRFPVCVANAMRGVHFPAPEGGEARLRASFELVPDQSGNVANAPHGAPRPEAAAYEGRFKTVMDFVAHGEKEAAIGEATRWHAEQPGDILALVALGEALEAKGDVRTAARAYGSILELFSFRADSRRFAGERLERLHDPSALTLALDSYKKAVEQRPDHPASHRLYAFTLLKHGEHEKAFEALKVGATRSYPAGRFAGADKILREDLGLAAAAWAKAQPARAGEIQQKLVAAGGRTESDASLRFVLVWETDANDVDFHIYDGRGGHAYYGSRTLPSGGDLYADVTTGYGPECFTIRGARAQRAYPYTLQAHYYSRGPMGYGMGKLEVVEHDGHGGLTFDERPFVVMKDRAFVDLGVVTRDTSGVTASLK